uniref:PHD-type domain-containing protein n=1 Tax=Anopheles funestus TaxID=62324 RepID=A0A4Y0BHR4_ANOFN
MPLLKRKLLQKVTDEPLQDSDEVFVCEKTGELFANYDDFFNRTMLLSSTVWSCAMTGRSNLTYTDALESERSAKRSLTTIPAALTGPILLIASRTKRTGIHDMVSDVHGYAKDVYFKGEIVHTKTGVPETIRKAQIVRVVMSDSPSEYNPSRLIYHVESCDEKTPANYSVRGESIVRQKSCLSREKCKMFLQQHVERGPNKMLCIKTASLEQFVTSTGCTEEKVFYGQKPNFSVSKKLLAQKHSHKDAKTETVSIEESIDSIVKENKQKVSKAVANKKAIVLKKEERKAELAKQKLLAKEVEVIERALLLPQVALAQTEYSAIKEDLELTDQRVIPPAREVRPLIGEENFPDFLFILEFLNTFGDLLSIDTKFPAGVTMELLEQALLLREINGPLNDILQLLLSVIVGALKDVAASNKGNLEPGTKKVIKWCTKQFSTNLTDLPRDSTTVSELVRLHIIAYNQATHDGDACFVLIRDHPHILQALTTQTIFQLPVKNVMQIICALIHQLLLTDEFLDRMEQIRVARNKLKNNQQEQQRLPRKTAALKQDAQESMIKTLASHEGQMVGSKLEECRKELEQKLTAELEQIETDACLKMKELRSEWEALKRNFHWYQVHLGSDRGFRNYWQFQSLPGLFVEHDRNGIGRCLERVTNNIPGLAQCEQKRRKRYISASILKCAGNSNGLLEKEENVYEQLLLRGSTLLEHSNVREKRKVVLDKANVNGVKSATSSKMKKAKAITIPIAHPTNRELFMCTGDEENCPVHTSIDNSPIAKWGFYATRQELDALIKSLNPRGQREQALRVALMLYRESIESRMEDCPIANLSIQVNAHTMTPTRVIEPQSKETKSDMPQSDLLETMFRESLLELETRISVGGLGKLKVNSIDKWRNAIFQGSYDSQTNQLQWGGYESKNNSSGEESDAEPVDVFALGKKDPGNNLPISTNTNASTQSNDASQLFQELVRSMASALLQVEQGIDIKFYRHPFGPKGIHKGPNSIAYWRYHFQKRILRWEASLMRATSFSQLFLHYHVLYDAIRWSRSIERAVCMVCRLQGGDASVLLLCHECSRACHTYCLKPKLKKIPEGDWFCTQCIHAMNDSDELSVSEDDSPNDNVDGNAKESTSEESEHGDFSPSDEDDTTDTDTDTDYEASESDEDYEYYEPPVKCVKRPAKGVQPPAKSIQKQTDTNEGHAKKRKLSNDISTSTARQPSLDTGVNKINASARASRSTSNQGKETVRNERSSKRVRQTESKNVKHTKNKKTSEDINIPTAGRRSLRNSK